VRIFLALVVCLFFSVALARPSFENKTAYAGQAFKADLMVTHGCGDSPTISLIVDIPEEVVNVTPRVKPGWTIQTVESELAEPRTVFGMQMTKYVSQIIWSGGGLSSDHFDVFSFLIIPPSGAMTLYFPATQRCVEGVDAYIGIPDPAAPDKHLPDSAPSLTVIKSKDDSGH